VVTITAKMEFTYR